MRLHSRDQKIILKFIYLEIFEEFTEIDTTLILNQ